MPESSTRIERIVAVNGSPRTTKGVTDIVVKRFLAGAEAAGASTEVVYPARLKIGPCIGCLDCWFKHPGTCRQKDDMPSVIEKLRDADLLVFASPVYVDGMTSQMKKFFDRLVSTVEPYFEFLGTRTFHPQVGLKEPNVVAISVCGFPEREHFRAISLTFQRICENMRADLLGEFYFPGSSIIVSDPEAVESHMDAVEKAGREVVTTGGISTKTVADANRVYIDDPADFGRKMNALFENLRKGYGVEQDSPAG